MTIKSRNFRSSRSARRSSGEKQVILPIYLLLRPTKEIVFSWQKSKKKGRKKVQNRPNLLIGQSILPFVLIVAGFGGIIYFSKQSKNESMIEPVSSFSVPLPEVEIQKKQEVGLAASKPTRVKVKRVGIDAPVINVGQNKDKTIEVPPLFENVTGWYKLGPTPGEIGPAIIVGHVDTYKGPSVFYSLKDLKAGDIIEITREDKSVVEFEVTGLKQFSQSKFPTEEVYGNIDFAGLRLITCGGSFNEQTQEYTANTVVFAKIVEDKS